jgi:ATP-dependent RNA circularization protein (DNA/RNA ligase family)
MKSYHKIQTVFKRDPENKFRTLLTGEYAIPEFEYLENNQWVFTEKVDGMNIRVMFNGDKITFGGKTERAQIPAFLVSRLNEMFLTQASVFSDNFPDGVCLYGEGYGAKIQKGGGNYNPHQDFVLFDVKVGDWWLRRADVEKVADLLSLDIVPIIGRGTLYDMVEIVSNGFTSRWGDFLAEGVVARPGIELKTRSGDRIITKLKYKDFVR